MRRQTDPWHRHILTARRWRSKQKNKAKNIYLNKLPNIFSLLFHRLAVRISLPFHVFLYGGSLFTDPLFSLQSRVWVIINKRQGIYSVDRQRNGVVVGEEENRRVLALLANVFEKNKKKNKTTSVYRLIQRDPARKGYLSQSSGISKGRDLLVKVYKRVGKSVVWVCERL